MRKLHFNILFTTFALLFFQQSISAQAGSLDLTFDTDGFVVSPFGANEDKANAIAVQADGKIVVAGFSEIGDVFEWALIRCNVDGTLDNTFDSDGKVNTAINATDNRAYAIAIQNDGKIVVAGYYSNGTSYDFAVVRYNSDGSLDNLFGNNGIATAEFSEDSNDRAFAMAIDAESKIVVSGFTSQNGTNRDFGLVRFMSDGNLDVSFDDDGIVTTILENGDDEIQSILIQNDGKIVAAGYSFDFQVRKFAAVRYNQNGSIDSSFGANGIVKTSIGGIDDAAYAAVLQADGKIILTGYTIGETYDFATLRYNSDGSIDSTFNSDGIVITSFSTNDADLPYTISLQSDGKIIVAGNSSSNFALVRYNADGSLDNTFGTNGFATNNLGDNNSDDAINALALQSDGKILAAGFTSTADNYDIAIARYNHSGTASIIEVFENMNQVKIFPNPVSSKSTLRFEEPLKNACLNIFSSSGQVLKKLENISGDLMELNCDKLNDGFYYLQIVEVDKTIIYSKFVVAK